MRACLKLKEVEKIVTVPSTGSGTGASVVELVETTDVEGTDIEGTDLRSL